MSGKGCTCPEPVPSAGLGTPVVLPGKAHRRECPVVQPIFDVMNAPDGRVRGTGLLIDPEVARLRDEVRDLRRRLDAIEATQ